MIEKNLETIKARIERIEQGLNALDSALAEYGDNLLALSNLVPKAKPARESKQATESSEAVAVDERVEAFNAKRAAWGGVPYGQERESWKTANARAVGEA